jgi:predicted phosphate transport protein (TIGR00153 family)
VPFQVIPRELVFFDLLDRAASNAVLAARELVALVDDLPGASEHAQRIEDLEHAGDDLTHEVIARLNTTFVTPIDRHDLHRLASHTDDVVDFIEGISELLLLHRIDEVLPQFRQQLDVLVRATESMQRAVVHLRSLRSAAPAIAQLKRDEREGDFIYRRAVAALYSGDYRPLEVLKWRDLLEQAEAAVDRCEDIGNTVESISLKFA